MFNKYIPKKLKYKKMNRSMFKVRGISKAQSQLYFGNVGLKVLSSFLMTPSHIETCRRIIKKHLKKRGKLKINVFCYVSRTAKPLEVRMGKGKGNLKDWVSPVNKGRILFELLNIKVSRAKKILLKLGKKLPVRVSIVSKL